MKLAYQVAIALGAWAMSYSNPALAQATKADTSQPEKVPFCELAANAEKYDGHVVLTEGVVSASRHTNVLIDPLCDDWRDKKPGQLLRALPTFADPNYLDSEPAKQYLAILKQDSVVRVVIVALVDSPWGTYGQPDIHFRISIRTLVSVYRMPQTEKDIFGFLGPPPIPTGK